MVVAKKWVCAEPYHGEPKLSNFRLEEEQLSDTLNDGEILIEGIYHSVDPYMRAHGQDVGTVVMGTQVAKVLKSKNSKHAEGSLVVANVGWRDKTIVSDGNLLFPCFPLPGQPPSLCLGTMGMPGMTAYFGFLELCTPKSGETVLVNGAAGAVGSVVGQIAKIKECTVIGFAGTSEKCNWLKELGFDHVFNYKEVDLDESLKTAAPEGIDCYFDNVGGEFTAKVFKHMKLFGRISVCGGISGYNAKETSKVPIEWMDLVWKQLRVEGFVVLRWLDKWPEALKVMAKWIMEGKVKTRETVTEGFENMPQAFMSMLKGGNIGKAIVKA